MNTLACLSPHISHCKPNNKSFMKSHNAHNNFPFCGNILILPISFINTKLSLRVIKNHILQFYFLLFIFDRTLDTCGPDKLHLIDKSMKTSHIYCGSRMPWELISTGRHCEIIIHVTSSSTSRMMLFYHAII